jgi:predicted ATP-binding protein involved in virulence
LNDKTENTYFRKVKENFYDVKEQNLDNYYVHNDTFKKSSTKSLPLIVYYPVIVYHTVKLDDVPVPFQIESDWIDFNPFTNALSSEKLDETIPIFLRYSHMENADGALNKSTLNFKPLLKVLGEFLGADLSMNTFSSIDKESWTVNPITRIDGIPIFPNALSDGFITTFAVVIDLFVRLCKLPEQLESKAIIIMDEVSVFLHPSWQAKFIQ